MTETSRTPRQTQITMTQMSGQEVEVVVVQDGGRPAIRTLSEEKAAELARQITIAIG